MERADKNEKRRRDGDARAADDESAAADVPMNAELETRTDDAWTIPMEAYSSKLDYNEKKDTSMPGRLSPRVGIIPETRSDQHLCQKVNSIQQQLAESQPLTQVEKTFGRKHVSRHVKENQDEVERVILVINEEAELRETQPKHPEMPVPSTLERMQERVNDWKKYFGTTTGVELGWDSVIRAMADEVDAMEKWVSGGEPVQTATKSQPKRRSFHEMGSGQQRRR